MVVLALPRGGLPVGSEVAKRLQVPLDVFVVRKIGVPGHEELAMGAIASGDVRVLNQEVIDELAISPGAIDEMTRRETDELRRREQLYRQHRHPVDVREKTVILVDDGLATGSTARVAVRAVKQHAPTKIIVAVPVAAPSVCKSFEAEVDEVVCAITPERFLAVGAWYEEFPQLTDEDVRQILVEAG